MKLRSGRVIGSLLGFTLMICFGALLSGCASGEIAEEAAPSQLSIQKSCERQGEILSLVMTEMNLQNSGEATDEDLAKVEQEATRQWMLASNEAPPEMAQLVENLARASEGADFRTDTDHSVALGEVIDFCQESGFPVVVVSDAGA